MICWTRGIISTRVGSSISHQYPAEALAGYILSIAPNLPSTTFSPFPTYTHSIVLESFQRPSERRYPLDRERPHNGTESRVASDKALGGCCLLNMCWVCVVLQNMREYWLGLGIDEMSWTIMISSKLVYCERIAQRRLDGPLAGTGVDGLK